LNREKFLRNSGSSLSGVIDDDGQEEGMIVGHVEGSLDGQPPLPAEITLRPRCGLRGYERHEEIAFAYLSADLLIPHIPSVQPTLVVPNFESKRRQGVPNRLRRRAIFRRVAEEHGKW
jgi:hypothetical protein